MPLNSILLDGNDWSLTEFTSSRQDPRIPPPYTALEHVHWDKQGTVPGNVQTDLLALGKIPDPFIDLNSKKITWIEDYDWIYRKVFTIPENQDLSSARLICRGLDYIAHIFINKEYIGMHEGMFGHVDFAIHKFLKKGNNSIVIWLRAPRHYADWRVKYPRIQMTYGWDISPRIMTAGIWDSVQIEFSEPVFFKHNTPHLNYQDQKPRIQFSLWRDMPDPGTKVFIDHQDNFEIKYHLSPKNFPGQPIAGSITLGYNIVLEDEDLPYSIPLPESQIQCWQPWEMGTPALYEVQLELFVKGKLCDKVAFCAGFRSITRNMNPQADPLDLPWTFVLNNNSLYIRGTNWIPADVFPGRVTPEKYRFLLEAAKSVGTNMLRIWGGGLREKDAFYAICDELGLLIWQEFPVACIISPNFPKDPTILKLWRSEAKEIILALRSHPCIVQWSGGNENNVILNSHIIGIFQDLCALYTPDTPYQGSSPMVGQGETHNYQVWHGYANYATIKQETTTFCSEFGTMGSPSLETWKKCLSPNNQKPWTKAFSHHLPQFVPLYGSKPRLLRYMLPYAPRWDGDSLEGFVDATQTGQAQYMQIAIEHFRRQKPKNSGFMTWQWNEPWPEISLGAIDYYGHYKKVFITYKRICQPVLISIEYELKHYRTKDHFTGTLFVINDLITAFDASIQIICNQKVVFEQKITVKANQVNSFGKIHFDIPEPTEFGSNLFCKLFPTTSIPNNNTEIENEYDLEYEDPIQTKNLARLQKRSGDITLSSANNMRDVIPVALQQFPLMAMMNLWYTLKWKFRVRPVKK